VPINLQVNGQTNSRGNQLRKVVLTGGVLAESRAKCFERDRQFAERFAPSALDQEKIADNEDVAAFRRREPIACCGFRPHRCGPCARSTAGASVVTGNSARSRVREFSPRIPRPFPCPRVPRVAAWSDSPRQSGSSCTHLDGPLRPIRELRDWHGLGLLAPRVRPGWNSFQRYPPGTEDLRQRGSAAYHRFQRPM
jgi:hypothetical protein